MKKDIEPRGEVVIYQDLDGEAKLSVRVQDDTVWLSQKQIAHLFNKNVRTISEHILNVFKEGELDKSATLRKFRIVQEEGNRKVERKTDFYSLDVIISVGYRVKSKQGIQFRIWANKILKEYLLKGYVLNEKLMEVRGRWQELNRAINLFKEKVALPQLKGQEQELINLISSYSNSLRILEEYDSSRLSKKGLKKATYVLSYGKVQQIINDVKEILVAKGEASKDLFGHEIDAKLNSVIGCINQTFGGKDLYKTLEEKAANLLYLVVKGHVFTDGNKRLGSILFIYFLEKNNFLYNSKHERKINDHSLAVLALLVANSNPKDKDIIVDLIISLLKVK